MITIVARVKMSNLSSPSTPDPANLCGSKSEIFFQTIEKINESIDESEVVEEDYNNWKEFTKSYLGLIEGGEFVPNIESNSEFTNKRYLYSCRIYTGLIVDSLLSKIECRELSGVLIKDVPLHSWVFKNRTILKKQRNRISDCLSGDLTLSHQNHIDPLRDLIREIIPEEVRHILGAVYTPDWLVEHTLDRFEPDYSEGSFLDPACGTGVFLLKVINEMSERGLSSAEIVDRAVGVELSPMDTLISRFNYVWLLDDLGLSTEVESIPVYNTDFVLGLVAGSEEGQQTLGSFNKSQSLKFVYPDSNNNTIDNINSNIEKKFAENQLYVYNNASPFDYIVGNPPWIAWENHGETYRNAIAQRWENKGLFTQSGWRSKVAAGKTDISSMFVYEAVSGYLKQDGIISFLLPINLFKNPSGGEGFRRFKTKDDKKFSPILVEDLNSCQAFKNRTTSTCIAVFKNGSSPDYPVPYYLWTENSNESRKDDPSSFNVIEQVGQPAHRESTSSWINGSPEFVSACEKFTGSNQYTARSGVNTGGANGLFHLKILKELEDDYRITNHSPRARKNPGDYEGLIEKELVRPLVKGSDVSSFSVEPSQHIFLPYCEDNPKKAIPQGKIKENYPKSYEFVSFFEEFLKNRSEFGRWGGGEFYKLFRIGPYTFADHKVVWQQTGISTGIQSGVISNNSYLPDQKVPLIPVEDLDEAHYICGIMNSSFISTVLDSYLMIDASPGIMDSLNIPGWEKSELQNEIANISQYMHDESTDVDLISELDDLVAELYNLSPAEKKTLLES